MKGFRSSNEVVEPPMVTEGEKKPGWRLDDDRLGWMLGWTVLGSLSVLSVLYLRDPDLERRVKNFPLPPNDLSIEDPRFLALWCITGLGFLLMVLWLGIQCWRRRDGPSQRM